jgi:enoyl-CoA hydratase/carnithine racemase
MSVHQTTQETHIRILTIDNPPVNPLDKETWTSLSEAIDGAMDAADIRVVVITGAGEKAFVAGANLNELQTYDAQAGQQMVSEIKNVMAKLRNGPKPSIAAINGLAAGGGLELAMGCDIRVVERSAMLGLPEVTLGVLPGAGGTQMLPRLIGIGPSLKMLLTGELISSQKALDIGLVDELVEDGEALNVALKLGKKIARNAPLAIAEIKKAAYATLSQSLENGLQVETEAFGRLCETQDKVEGIAAFKERRKPKFSGK